MVGVKECIYKWLAACRAVSVAVRICNDSNGSQEPHMFCTHLARHKLDSTIIIDHAYACHY